MTENPHEDVELAAETAQVLESATLGKLFGALSVAQGEIQSATRDKKNPFYNSSYADLESVIAVIREPFAKVGLCVVQRGVTTERGTVLETRLGHSSGEWIASVMPIKPEKNGIHAVGSAITYMRRYALMAIAGVAPAYDDGNAAVK